MKIGDLIEIYTVQEEDIIGLVTDLRNQKSSRMGVTTNVFLSWGLRIARMAPSCGGGMFKQNIVDV